MKAKDVAPQKKKEFYASQDLALTKALAHSGSDVSDNEKMLHRSELLWKKARVDLDTWGPKDIELRTKLYVELFIEDMQESVKPFIG